MNSVPAQGFAPGDVVAGGSWMGGSVVGVDGAQPMGRSSTAATAAKTSTAKGCGEWLQER